VQNVVLKKPTVAKQTLARANCRVGKLRGVYSNFAKGFVISQKPRPGTVLPGGSKVNLVVSRGRKPS
jgi:beta-lactam-binding protein with PASTA domain